MPKKKQPTHETELEIFEETEVFDEDGDLIEDDIYIETSMSEDEEDDEDGVIELFDEDGNSTRLEHILTFEHEDSFYVAFLPIDEIDSEENEVVFMRLDEDENGADVFYTIDSEDELEKVWQTFLQIYEEEEDLED